MLVYNHHLEPSASMAGMILGDTFQSHTAHRLRSLQSYRQEQSQPSKSKKCSISLLKLILASISVISRLFKKYNILLKKNFKLNTLTTCKSICSFWLPWNCNQNRFNSYHRHNFNSSHNEMVENKIINIQRCKIVKENRRKNIHIKKLKI